MAYTKWILPSLLILTVFCLLETAAGREVEEKSAVTLKCKTSITKYTEKAWYREYFDDSKRPPQKLKPLFLMFNGNDPLPKGARPDMSADKTTFNLTIGDAQLEDNGNFTCQIRDTIGDYHFVNPEALELYIIPTQPLIDPTPDPSKNHVINAEENLTVTCTVDRVYPNITEGDFKVTLNGKDMCMQDDCTIGRIVNTDKSLKYELTWIKKVHAPDNNGKVICVITTKYGGPIQSAELILDVHYAPSVKPTVEINNTEPYVGDTVWMQCSYDHIGSNPKVTFREWTLNGTSIGQTKDVYIINNIQKKDAGCYECIVGNEIGTIESDPCCLVVRSSNNAGFRLQASAGAVIGMALLVAQAQL